MVRQEVIINYAWEYPYYPYISGGEQCLRQIDYLVWEPDTIFQYTNNLPEITVSGCLI